MIAAEAHSDLFSPLAYALLIALCSVCFFIRGRNLKNSLELLTSTDPDGTGSDGPLLPRGCPMTSHQAAWDKPGNASWASISVTDSADGAPSQGCGQSSSQHAVGSCGHYLQLGAAHGWTRCAAGSGVKGET